MTEPQVPIQGAPEQARRNRAMTLFADAFGTPCEVIGRAPGRVNVLGDHIDYCGGVVLPMALQHDALVLIARAGSSGRLRVSALDLNETLEADARTARTPSGAAESGSWASYVFGAVAETLGDEYESRLAGTGLDIAVTSSVPVGAGLSSSAAIEVAVAVGLDGLLGLGLDRMEIARRCRRAEHRYTGVPCGLMDQAASAMCKAGHVMELDCQSETARHHRLPDTVCVLVLDTGVKHALAESAYADRQRDCEDACRMLGIGSLRALVDQTTEDGATRRVSALPDGPRAAATHVVSEIRRVFEGIRALKSGEMGRFGRLMTESHASLRDVYRVSCEELDAVVDAAVACSGVLGARMTGGGFGGCAVALVERDQAEAAMEAIRLRVPAASLAHAWVAHPSHGATCTLLSG